MSEIDHHNLYRAARIWSNQEIEQLGPHFKGDICNVSAWQDGNKQGGHYRDYFPHATSYTITNFRSKRGYQGIEGEIELDLSKPLDQDLQGRFDVILNHTVLEHIYDFRTAFKNLCLLTTDIVIVVLPFLQLFHHQDGYSDYWRFSPTAIQKMFQEQGMEVVYHNWNNQVQTSVYVVSVGSKNPEKWAPVFGTVRPVLRGELGYQALGIPVKKGQPPQRKTPSYMARFRRRLKSLFH